MAIEMKTDGMEELSEMLEQLANAAPAVAAQALYKGAGIMAAEINQGARSIKTAPFKYAGKDQTRLPSPEEVDALLSVGAGVAKFDKNGTEVNTSIGYGNTGYANINGKQKPIPLIANSINSGTSFMQKQPFVRKAAKSGGTKAMQAMAEAIEAEVSAMTK
jgi:hypothetical protein